jgi:D-glycero-alpha-D-manno-heptose 1-phosphate guanylyltransferase
MKLTIYATHLILLIKVDTAIILAGGKGTRLQSAVSNVPKPMAPINNRPFLEYLMDYWIEQGISKFILSIGYMKESIINHFGDNYQAASIEYSEEMQPLGTGGGLIAASKKLNDTFLVINGDTFFEINLDHLFQFHMKKKSQWTFSLFSSVQLERYMAMDVSKNGQILSLKTSNSSVCSLSNGGVYLIDPSVLCNVQYQKGDFMSLEDDLLPSIFSNDRKVFGIEFKGKFIDIGIPEDYFLANKILLN